MVVDGGDVLAESGAIIEALLERQDPAHALSPRAGSAEALRHRYWLHYAEGPAMPPLLMSLMFGRVRSAPMPFFARPIARGIADTAMRSFVGPQLKLHFDYMEAELGKHAWFAGERVTAADIQLSFAVEAGAVCVGYEGRPRLQDFLQRIRARPAYQRALERGGPYALGA